MSFNVRESHQQKEARIQKEKEDKAAKEQETIDRAKGLQEQQDALIQNVEVANEFSQEVNGKAIMKTEVKHIQRAIPDGLKQKRQNRAAKQKAGQEKSQCKPKLVTVEEAITVLDIHKFLNRQNESFLDETIVSQKTDMMGMK